MANMGQTGNNKTKGCQKAKETCHVEPFGIHTLLLTHPGILEKDSVNAGRRTQASCQAKVERSAKVTGAGCLGKLHLLSEASAKRKNFRGVNKVSNVQTHGCIIS